MPSSSVVATGLLVRLARDLRTALDQRFAAEGLTSQQAGVLIHVHTGVRSPKVLADLLGTDSAGMTRMLDRLVAKGLLERTPDPQDRRAVSVQLTTPGKRVVKRLPAGFEEVAARLVRGVDPDRLVAELNTLLENLAADS
jgi:DNA-binding MarR family transcriptional regulator